MSKLRGRQRSLPRRSEFPRWLRGNWYLALSLWLGANSCFAQTGGQVPATPGWLDLDTDLSVDRETIDTRWSSVVRPPSSPSIYALVGARPLVPWGSMNKMPTMIELSPSTLAASEPQAYVRPQFALGGSSESLRSWLRVAGIDAAHCIAPMWKMHSSFAGSSSHANVSLSARCSLH